MCQSKGTPRKFESAQEELEIYKRLFAGLPIDIDYIDEKTKIRMKKNERSIAMEEMKGKDSEKSNLVFPSIF